MSVRVQCVFTSPERYQVMLWVGEEVVPPVLIGAGGRARDEAFTTGIVEFPTWEDALEHVRSRYTQAPDA